MEKPRVVEGIVLDRDGTPLTAPAESARRPSARANAGAQSPLGATFKLFKPSPLMILGAVIAIPLILALLMFVGAFMLITTLITGKRPRIVSFSKFTRR